LARRGKEVVPEPRKIHISDFAITEVDLPRVRFSITCSTGTYIRSVAHDFGQKLGCGAYLSALRRTKIGEFSVDDALTVDAFLELISVKKDS
jgi:tRNA pseudouridine55 synthase